MSLRRAIVVSVVLCLSTSIYEETALCAQSAKASPESTATFHIQGTVESPWDGMFLNEVVSRSSIKFDSEQMGSPDENGKSPYIKVPRSEVRFHSDHLDRTVIVDEKGFYQADLPVGFYKMTVNGPTIGQQSLMPYVRAFQVSAPTSIVIDTTLQLAALTCDAIPESDDVVEETKDDCGGADTFSSPSADGTPYEIFIRYPRRELERYGLRYTGRVFVAYNLYSLQANEVKYNTKHHLIAAIGDVVVEDGSGRTEHLTGLHWMFQDGVAAQFREQLPRPSQYDQAVSGAPSRK